MCQNRIYFVGQTSGCNFDMEGTTVLDFFFDETQ